jgi:tRNA(fMet)-specific endonuclease VapC
LLDTNVIIALFKGDVAVQKNLTEAEKVFIPAIVLGELYYGARKSGRVERNMTQIEEFVGSVPVLACSTGTAREYGIIKNQLRVKGRPIPENDIWIAAVARQRDLVLVSRDDHFAKVEGIKLEKW